MAYLDNYVLPWLLLWVNAIPAHIYSQLTQSNDHKRQTSLSKLFQKMPMRLNVKWIEHSNGYLIELRWIVKL